MSVDHITPVCILGYAVWTIDVQVLSLIHGSFVAVLWSIPLAVVVATILAWWWVTCAPRMPAEARSTFDALGSADAGFRPTRWIAAAAIVWVVVYAFSRNFTVFWWGGVIGLAAAWFWLARTGEPSAVDATAPKPGALVALLTICVVAALVTLVANRPDIDDALYLSIPATLIHSPHQPILLHDTLYRLPHLPIEFVIYREHTYEVLIGAVSWLLGIDPVRTAYLVFPPIAAVLTVFAWTQLLRLLSPRYWLHILALLVLGFLVLGEVHHAYGNFAFVRIFQGKAILMSWGIPAVLYFALSFSRFGRSIDWWMLCASQVACIGLSSTGLFVVPVAAAIALGSTWRPGWIRKLP